MHPDVLQDPVFQDLLRDYELASRKFRDAIIALRAYHLSHHKSPTDESMGERWRTAHLQNAASAAHDRVEETAAQLLRYGYEIAPHSSCSSHLAEIEQLRNAHKERINRRSGWKESADQHPHRGIEERVQIDGGPPITIVLRPEHYSFSKRSRRHEPAMDPETGGPDS